MPLDNRKLQILQAIVEDYISNGEPVASSAIAKRYDLGFSSATIRNEMAELEVLGLIKQPHISAGRIPSDNGYRIYVDNLMPYYTLSKKEIGDIKKELDTNAINLNQLLNNLTKTIAELTNYISIAVEPQTEKNIVKYIRLLPIEYNKILLLVVTNDSKAREIILKTNYNINEEVLHIISEFLNKKFYDNVIEDIIENISFQMDWGGLISEQNILNFVFQTLKKEIKTYEDITVFYGGTENIFNFREFSDSEKAKNLFEVLRDKTTLAKIFKNTVNESVEISIGKENPSEKIKECSLARTTYKFGNNVIGQIAVIGPTRMNYSKVRAYMDYITKELDELFGNI